MGVTLWAIIQKSNRNMRACGERSIADALKTFPLQYGGGVELEYVLKSDQQFPAFLLR